jgi:hypothetical protein
MILKGGPRAKAAELAAHLIRTDTNETVRVMGFEGVAAQNVRGALLEMEAVAAGGRTSKPLYHISISPEADERLTDAQWTETADRLGKALNLADHQRLMVLHTKNGRQHAHIVWNRVDIETLKTAHHSHNYRTHEQIARALEREFGLKRTQGRHAEVEGERPEKKRPSTRESQQAARTGWDADQAKTDILAAWQQSDNGAAFRAHLLANGYQLARGDKRDVVVLDPGGGIHSVARRARVKVAEVRSRLADLDLGKLPSVEEAKALIAAAPARMKETARPQRRLPQPGQYEPLKIAPPALARRSQNSYPTAPTPAPRTVPSPVREVVPPAIPPAPARLPQPVLEPKPPTWMRPSVAVPPPRPGPSVAPPSPVPAPVRPVVRVAPVVTPPSPEAAALAARQAGQWQQTVSRIEAHYQRSLSELQKHHDKRLVDLVADIDVRLHALNGIASRANALSNPASRSREIAYLVAVRQRKLAEERTRQEQVKADLKAAKEKELAEAKAKHDRLAALQRTALAQKEGRPDVPVRTRGRPQDDYER